MATPVRLQRYLAAAGVAARRKAEDLITAGRVTVNGAVVTVLGTKVDPDRDQVTVDGEAVVPLDHFYVLFNKPKACITAVSDDRGRLTVMDYLPNMPVPVKPVGRLDFYTEGVLLLTNDGELAAKLLAPASHVPKTYHVKVHGQVHADDVKQLRNGVQLDDGTVTLPADIEVLPGESKHTWLAITIHEGKHRQIHRMVEALGYYVDKLQRVAFANLTFHHLRVGDARELTQQELNELRDLVGLDHSAVARGKWKSTREQTDIPRRAHAKALAEAEAAILEGTAAPGMSGDAGPERAGEDDREDTFEWQGSDRFRHDRRPEQSAARPDRRAAQSDRRPPDRRAAQSDRRPPDRREAQSDRRPAQSDRRQPFGRDQRASGGRDQRTSSGRDQRTSSGRDQRTSIGRDQRTSSGRDSTAPKRSGQGRTFGKRVGPPTGARGAGAGARSGPTSGRSSGPSSGRSSGPSGGRSSGPSGGRSSGPSGGRSSGPGGRSSGPGGRSSGPGGRSSGPGGRSSGPGGRSSGPGGRTSGGGRSGPSGGRSSGGGGSSSRGNKRGGPRR